MLPLKLEKTNKWQNKIDPHPHASVLHFSMENAKQIHPCNIKQKMHKRDGIDHISICVFDIMEVLNL